MISGQGSRNRSFLRSRFFFTPIGAAVLVIALVILIRSLFFRNAYEIILSSAALLLLLVTGIIGAWKSAKLKNHEAGWKTQVPYFADNGADKTGGEDSLVTGLGVPLPLFFRLHFLARGKFSPAGSANLCPVFAETSAARGEKTARLQLDFPMSGIFQGEGFCLLRDIFGFYSFTCGEPQQKTIKVRSAPFFGKKPHINAQSGAEDKRSKTSTNEERYYMREYTPGDRLRDINWKSSEKLDVLVTRISPDNHEKVSRLEIYFRNYGASDKTSLEALWLLDRAKARLSHFLRTLNEEHSSYIFCVHAAQGSWEIENSEDLETFLDELAFLPFAAPKNENAISTANAQTTGELYVFSTACDIGLNGFIAACSPRPVSLFFVQPVVHKKEEAANKTPKAEIFLKRNFFFKNCLPLPRWIFGGGKIQQGVFSGATAVPANKTEIIYAETKL